MSVNVWQYMAIAQSAGEGTQSFSVSVSAIPIGSLFLGYGCMAMTLYGND